MRQELGKKQERGKHEWRAAERMKEQVLDVENENGNQK